MKTETPIHTCPVSGRKLYRTTLVLLASLVISCGIGVWKFSFHQPLLGVLASLAVIAAVALSLDRIRFSNAVMGSVIHWMAIVSLTGLDLWLLIRR